MQASETKLRQLIEGTKQYVVPLFQRPYSWSEKQWNTLWTDLVEQARHEDGRPHFFGSIVTAPAKSVPQGVGKFLLIDGQQRLTTTQVLLAAIRDLADRQEEPRLRERIDDQYLLNRHDVDQDRLKVLPTQDDRQAFLAIIQREQVPEGRLRSCYNFFIHKLDKLSATQLDKLHLAAVDRLSVVSITCDEHDNPHLIFESLNAKGEKLTAGDLIRNFLLMRVHVNDQDRLYQAYWLPIQQALGSELTEFVRHYLMKEGKILKEADVYFELKDRLANSTPAQAQEFLKDLHTHGEMYARFIAPSREPDPGIAKRLDRIRRLKVTVAYPFLLRVFHSFQLRTLSSEQVVETLDTLESFVIRRSVCGMPTNQLRRMLPPVFDAAGGAGPRFVELFREQIGGRRCPDDNSFRSALSKAQLYATAEKNARLRLILEGIELSFNHKELADLKSATIEHVLPQTLTEQWQDELGPGPVETWGTLVHTLGNLTLSAYNAELSNQPFAAKRKAFAESHFQLNRYFADVTRWTPEAIAERGEKLSALAVEIWPDVGRGSSALDTERRPSVSPKAVRFRDIREPAANWKDAYIKLLQLFESESPGLLTRIALVESNYGFVSLQGNRFQRSVIRLGDVYVNTHASATQLQNWCRRVAEIGGLAASDYEFIVSDQA